MGELLTILDITKQSLGRVLTPLVEGGYVEQAMGRADRRQTHPEHRSAARRAQHLERMAELGAGPPHDREAEPHPLRSALAHRALELIKQEPAISAGSHSMATVATMIAASPTVSDSVS